MSYKVVTTAKQQGQGSLSREHSFADSPSAHDLLVLKNEARDEYRAVYGQARSPVVDVTVRKHA